MTATRHASPLPALSPRPEPEPADARPVAVLQRLSRLGSWTTHRAAWLAELDRLVEAANDDGPDPG